jgi:PAS domain S-box-containing protein
MVIGVGDGVVVQANRAVCRMTGYTEEELIGQHVRDLTHPEDRELSGPFVKRLMAGEIPSFRLEKRYLRKDGQPFWAQATTATAHNLDGTIAFALGTVEDITERKRAEEEVRRSHELLQAIIDNTPALIFVKDLEGRVTIANRALCEAAGRDMQDVLGKTSRDVAAVPQDAEIRMANDRRVMETGQAILVEERSFGRIYLSVKFPLKDAQGHVVAVGGVSTDITERKRAEEALRREHRNLKHLLQSSDHERQLIAYEIHDGLAQHLAGAIMQLQAFDYLKSKKPPEAAKAFDAGMTMLQQGHFEARRLIAGVRLPILDESGIVEAVAHLVHEEGHEKGPKIEYRSRVDFDRLDPTLENAIYRIAQEALTNACQHSKSEKIRVTLSQHGDRLRIEIWDWGVGFDPKAVPKSHFGLEGIRQRARLLGGKCSIRSKVGKGTRIMVELPVVARDEEG